MRRWWVVAVAASGVAALTTTSPWSRGQRLEVPRAKKSELSPDLKRKLLQETNTPWRGVRLFFYGGFALSAGVGLVTAVAQLAGSLASTGDGGVPASQAAINVAVDLGVVSLCALGYRIDSRAAVDVTSEPRGVLSDVEAAERIDRLARLEVVVGAEDMTRTASLATLQTKANQNVVILGGPATVVDDALTDALIQQKLLSRAECLVVPVRLDADDVRKIDTAGFVATPAPDDRAKWLDYLKDEIDTAVQQGAGDAGDVGVVIAVRNDGTVARRGIGKPPWTAVIADLEAAPDAAATAAA
mmetsp:Transcript_2627/g.6789  ORF Transcript_2627/g.6789 Transcript_2627/m.6789 type:complete len:300 (-) Transcript_2627:727-1626(-)